MCARAASTHAQFRIGKEIGRREREGERGKDGGKGNGGREDWRRKVLGSRCMAQ
jgi:hypothetical protein